MNDKSSKSKLVPVLAATALVIILAGTLGARLISHGGRSPARVAP